MHAEILCCGLVGNAFGMAQCRWGEDCPQTSDFDSITRHHFQNVDGGSDASTKALFLL
jgi:hypothetical protein